MKKLFLLFLLVLLPVNVFAQSSSGKPSLFDSSRELKGFYVAPKLNLGMQMIDVKMVVSNSGEGKFDDSTINFGGSLAVGYDFKIKNNLPIRVEGEFATFSDGIITYKDPTGFEVDAETAITSFFINAYYDLHINKFSPYIGLGVGAAWNRLGSEIQNANGTIDIPSESTLNLAWNATIGTGYKINERLYFDASYRFANYGKGKSDSGQMYTYDPNTFTRTYYMLTSEHTKSVTSHHISAGIRYLF